MKHLALQKTIKGKCYTLGRHLNHSVEVGTDQFPISVSLSHALSGNSIAYVPRPREASGKELKSDKLAKFDLICYRWAQGGTYWHVIADLPTSLMSKTGIFFPV